MSQRSDKEKYTLADNSSDSKIIKITEYIKNLFSGKRENIPNNSFKGDYLTQMQLKNDIGIISNLKNFSEKTVMDVMVPRSDIISADINTSLEDLTKIILQHRHTRTLIYNEKLDNIVGFVHIKDLFEVFAGSKKKFKLKKLIRKHIISPHSMKLTDLLIRMQVTRTHIAVIIDEYGGTDGIVTIEDIIEEIVGRIDDEHDDEDSSKEGYKILQPGIVITDARVEIEKIEAIVGTKLKGKDDEFETIGGLLMSMTGNVPEKGEIVIVDEEIIAEIIESTARTIKQIKITYNPK